MEILGRAISNKAAQIISEYTSRYNCTLSYFDVALLGKHACFGALNTNFPSGNHSIYLETDINDEQFETTVLHELRHLQQQYIGFPILCNKVGNTEFASNRSFFENLGAKTQSSIMDIDVILWLESNGYSSSIFSDFNMSDDLSKNIAAITHNTLKDNYNLAEATLTLYFVHFRADENARAVLLNTFHDFPEVFSAFNDISELIDVKRCCDPSYITKVLCEIVNYFNMWSMYYVLFNGDKIRTRKEFQNFTTISKL